MNKFKITLENIQHINYLTYELDLSSNSLFCLVGKNGIGKTTLIKSIQNFKETNALDKMSRLNIIKENSKLSYQIGEKDYLFTPFLDAGRYILDNNSEITKDIKNNFYIEFPIPYGRRFDIYAKLGGDIGESIKTRFATQQYDEKPTELIDILNTIYGTSKYEKLEQIEVKNESYYIEPLSDENYLREDDFSSGEFMILQIYKLIKNQCKLIVIDELDISLDSSAQVKLIEELRKLTEKYSFNILFTTHSLAIMKTMEDNELYFMENVEDKVIIENQSYEYIKSVLFQFKSINRVILTEDVMLKNYIHYLLKNKDIKIDYKILYFGSSCKVVDIFNRNKEQLFFSDKKENTIIILDGDLKRQYTNENDIWYIPFNSIEKELLKLFEDKELNEFSIDYHKIEEELKNISKKRDKSLYKKIIGLGYMKDEDIFKVITDKFLEDVKEFQLKTQEFLS